MRTTRFSGRIRNRNYETQYNILQSRGLAEGTVKTLDLDEVPEFNGQGPQAQGILGVIRSARRAAVALGQAVASRIVALADEEAPAAGHVAPVDEVTKEDAQIAAFLGRIEVVPLTNTRLVDVLFTAADPEFAARALNAYAREYVQQNLDRRLQDTQQTLIWIGDQLKEQQRLVEASEWRMAQYRESQNALSLEDRQNIVVARLNQLNDAVIRAETTRVQRETLYVQVRDIDPHGQSAAAFPAVSQNPAVVAVKARLASLEAERAKLSGKYGERHPTIIKLNATIETAGRQLTTETATALESIRNEYRSALDEERRLKAQLEQQKQAAMALDQKNVGYTVLQREAESNRNVYEALLQHEKELQIVRNSRVNNVQLMDRAQVPTAPYTPNARKDWFLAVLIGLMVAAGLVFAIDYIDDTIKTPDEVAHKLNLPLLGLVPAVRGERVPLLSDAVPYDFGEACRALRTSLVFASGSDANRVISVTSSQPLEGKTTTACNLAMVLAVSGARVLLVDADMRRPGIHKALGLTNSVGLSQVLAGQASTREPIERTHDPNLFVLTAGKAAANPSELLASDAMKKLLTKLQSGPFDWVIIDSPPVLAVTDAVILSPSESYRERRRPNLLNQATAACS